MEIQLILLILILLFLGLSSVKIIGEHQRGVVLRLGRFVRVANPGIHVLIPFIEVQHVLDMRPVRTSIEPQECTTQDNVRIRVTTEIAFHLVDPLKAVQYSDEYHRATIQATKISLQKSIKLYPLSDILQQSEPWKTSFWQELNTITAFFGVELEAIEIQNIEVLN